MIISNVDKKQIIEKNFSRITIGPHTWKLPCINTANMMQNQESLYIYNQLLIYSNSLVQTHGWI